MKRLMSMTALMGGTVLAGAGAAAAYTVPPTPPFPVRQPISPGHIVTAVERDFFVQFGRNVSFSVRAEAVTLRTRRLVITGKCPGGSQAADLVSRIDNQVGKGLYFDGCVPYKGKTHYFHPTDTLLYEEERHPNYGAQLAEIGSDAAGAAGMMDAQHGAASAVQATLQVAHITYTRLRGTGSQSLKSITLTRGLKPQLDWYPAG